MDETKKDSKKPNKKKDSKSRKNPDSKHKPDRPGRNGGMLKSGNTINVGRPPMLPDLKQVMAIVLGKEISPGISKLESLMENLYQAALLGDTKAAQLLIDRGYGKALEKVIIDDSSKITNVIEVKFQDP